MSKALHQTISRKQTKQKESLKMPKQVKKVAKNAKKEVAAKTAKV